MRFAWFVATEVAAYAVGAVMLLALAAVAVVCLAGAVVAVTAVYLREEAGYLWRRLRGEPEEAR